MYPEDLKRLMRLRIVTEEASCDWLSSDVVSVDSNLISNRYEPVSTLRVTFPVTLRLCNGIYFYRMLQ